MQLHHHYNSTTLQLQLQLQLQLRYTTTSSRRGWGDRPGDHCNHCNHSKKHSSNHLSVHQWIRSAIRDSQQPTSPIGFLFLKLPPPPCAALLVEILARGSRHLDIPRSVFAAYHEEADGDGSSDAEQKRLQTGWALHFQYQLGTWIAHIWFAPALGFRIGSGFENDCAKMSLPFLIMFYSLQTVFE